VLLAHVLKVSRTHLLAHPERVLTASEQAAYEVLVQRCAQGEPLFYLIGRREFYGLDFQVDRRVLIPRPETELLVERALSLVTPASTIVDVGTGSGCIAVTLAVRLSDDRRPSSVVGRRSSVIYATDISPAALEVAQANAARHGVAGRITFLQGDLLAPLPGPVDLIVANLPYVARAEWGGLGAERNVVEFEPAVALDGGRDGLDLFRRFFKQAPAYLAPGGAILLEIGAGQAEAVVRLAQAAFPAAEIATTRDYAGLERIVSVVTHAR